MRWKWVLIIIAALVVSVVVVVGIILFSYDFNKFKPGIEQAAYEATGRELKLNGDIGLEIGFTPALVIEDVSFANAQWGSRPEAVSIKRFEVQVALLPLIGGNINIKRLIFIEPDILIETDSSGKSNLDFKAVKKAKAKTKVEEERADGELEMPSLQVGEFLIDSGRLTYKDGVSGKSTTVKLERMRVLGAAFSSVLSVDIKGSLDARSFALSAKIDSLAKLTDPAKGRGNISALKVKFGKNEITGNVEIDISGKRPKIIADLSSKGLDLRELHGKADGKGAGSEKKIVKRKKVFSSEPISLDPLMSADVALRFNAKKFILPALTLNDLDLKMSLKDGRMKVSPLAAFVGGGKLDVNIDLSAKGDKAALDARLKMAGLDLAKMGQELKLTEMLNGSIDMDIDVKGTGNSVASLMGSLSGKKKIVMGRGKIDNSFLKFMGGDLGTNVLKLLNPLAEREDYTVVNCMVVDFSITDGMARSNAIIFDTSYMSVIGKGEINLKTEKLDIALNPNPKKGLGGGGLGKITLSLGELARAFKLGGTFASPKLAIDKSQTMMTIGKYVGGKALFGPAGIATALVGKSSGDENPCLSAIEAEKNAPKPVKVEEKKKTTTEPAIEVPAEFKELGEGLKQLFGK